MKTSAFALFAGTVLITFCLGGVGGFFVAKFSDGNALSREPAKVLSYARVSLDRILTDESLTQAEIDMVSSDVWRLSEMEISWLEHKIWNHPNFPEFEAEFVRNETEWKAKFETAMKSPSSFDGGSMETADSNLRGSELLRERIMELAAYIEKMNCR